MTDRLEVFKPTHAKLMRSMADPRAVIHGATLATQLHDHAAAIRSLRAGDGTERQAARVAIQELADLASAKVKPGLEHYFSSQNVFKRADAEPMDTSTIDAMREATTLLKALAGWQRKLDVGSDMSNLIARICDDAVRLSARCVEEFKKLQSPDDFPDYRVAARNLLKLDSAAWLLMEFDRTRQAEEVRRLGNHHGKIALLSALDVIDRQGEHSDVFAHFDIAAMLVSFEDMVVVISQIFALVDREKKENDHPYIETLSENVLYRFEKGLFRLSGNYRKMFGRAMSGDGTKVPSVILSLVRVQVQIARIATLFHQLTGSETLAGVARKITEDLSADAAEVEQRLAGSADMQHRFRETYATLEALG